MFLTRARRSIAPWEVLPTILVGVIAIVWIARALSLTDPYDFGLAYSGGQEAWASGHPERLATWISTPFLGMAMALVSRVMTVSTAAQLFNVFNVALVLGLLGVVWATLRNQLPAVWWWGTLGATLIFAPLASCVWWKQFNLLALGLALVGFVMARRGRPLAAGSLVALSISIKPIVFLLPLALVSRHDTRRSGLVSVVWLAVVSGVAQVFMAIRAGSVAALSPLPALANFSEKAQPQNVWACHPENFAPASLLCRVAGAGHWTLQRVLVGAGIALLIAMANDAVRDRAGSSWALFSFACLLSPMLSPLAWSHYQILLAPMLLLLTWEFIRLGVPASYWAALLGTYGLAELVWRPLGTLPGNIQHLFGGPLETVRFSFAVMDVSQFAQYVLFLLAFGWFNLVQRRIA